MAGAFGPWFPSWSDFARSARESAFPDLWDSKVLDVVPALGNSGDKLFDVSGFNNHGTLTNMDPSGDWVVDPDMGYAIDYVSGSNDQIICGSAPILDDMPQFSIVQWVCMRALVDGKVMLSKATTGGNFGWWLKLSGTGGQFNFQVEFGGTDLQGTWGGTPAGTAIVANKWCCLAITYDGGATASTSLSAYKDGVKVALASSNNGTSSRVTDASYSVAIGNINGSTVASPDCLIGRTTIFNRIITMPETRWFFDYPYLDLMPADMLRVGKAPAAGPGIVLDQIERKVLRGVVRGLYRGAA